MSKISIVQKGESLPFVFDRGDETTDGFICTIFVKQVPADAATVSRVIPLTTTVNVRGETVPAWVGLLTSSEMNTIGSVGLGLWYIIAVLTNLNTGEEEQIPVRFSVAEAWAVVSVGVAEPSGDEFLSDDEDFLSDDEDFLT